MSASLIEQILARSKVALTDSTPAGGNVERDREDAYGADELPALNIRRTNSESSPFSDQSSRQLVTFDIDCIADGVTWSTKADALHMAAHQELLDDTVLASLGRGLRCTGTESFSESADRPMGKIVAHYQIQTLVRARDMTRAAT